MRETTKANLKEDLKFVLGMALVVMVLLIPFFAQAAHADALPDDKPTCIAHRGGVVAGHTEETIPTYTATLALAEDLEVEGDVRWTRTGFPMMLHDSDLGVFGAPDLDLAELSVGQAKGPQAATGDVMASLYDLRTLLLANPLARVQLELKEPMTPARWDVLAGRIDVLGARATLTSFSLATVRQAQDRGYRTGLLSAGDQVTTAAPVFIELWTNVNGSDVTRHRQHGVQTQAYTPNTEPAWDEMAMAGVTGLITDHPAACLAWAETMGTRPFTPGKAHR